MSRPHPPFRIFLGWDPAEMRAWNVAQWTFKTRTTAPLLIERLALPRLQQQGLYRRPTEARAQGYYDAISDAPMSTGHAIARFLVPALCGYDGWALFADGDILVRADVVDLFAEATAQYAVQVVKHQYAPSSATKMDGHPQTTYLRKNWSSVLLFNCGHVANRALTLDLVNTRPGRDLHRFCWLEDYEIGSLDPRWNVLIGEETHPDPAIAHFTLGTPDLPGYGEQPYADEWFHAARGCGYRLEPQAVAS